MELPNCVELLTREEQEVYNLGQKRKFSEGVLHRLMRRQANFASEWTIRSRVQKPFQRYTAKRPTDFLHSSGSPRLASLLIAFRREEA